MIDIERILVHIAPDAPSGMEDLGQTVDYVNLENETKGTPEQVIGKEVVQEAKPPDWQRVQKNAFALLTRSHDLRIAMFLIRAMLHNHGLPGLYTGLELLSGLVDDYWETLYPRLDPADGNDPMERINILWALSEGEDIIIPLKNACLFSPHPAITIALRDIHIASGKITLNHDADSQSALSLPMIEKAFKDCDVSTLESNRQVIHQSMDSLLQLENGLAERVGPEHAPEYEELKSMLREMAAFFDMHLPEPKPSKSSTRPAPAPTDPPQDAAPVDEQPATSTSTGKTMQTISSRQDVIHALDLICAYYDRQEPASPVPLLLKRARQLVEKNFIEIVQDLVPQASDQIKSLFGDYPEGE
ncbi:type VI secretion system associated membrane protein, ImpA-like [Desulfosarcina variabilis str. Montpellier]